jgi:hypothetical protein
MKIEKAIVAGIEPVMDGLVALEKRVDQIQLVPGPAGEPGKDADPAAVAQVLAADTQFTERLKGATGAPGVAGEPGEPGQPGAPGRDADPAAVAQALAADGAFTEKVKGVPGEPGKDGTNGTDGAGIAAPQWVEGAVYRQGTVVTANIGQYFVALKDTASSPDEPAHWQRLGSGGLRHRGEFDKDATYIDGDLFVKDFGTFAIVNGTPVILAGRGAAGRPGERGIPGPKGTDGKDGSTIIGAEVRDFKLVLVQESPGGIDHIEADFGPAHKNLARRMLHELLPDLTATLIELNAKVDRLEGELRRRSA